MMRSIILAIFLFTFGIAKPINIYLDGYIIHSNNSKEKCSVKVPFNIHNQINFLKLMKSVSVRNSEGFEINFSANEIKEFAFSFEGRKFKFASFEKDLPVTYRKKSTFMQVVDEGIIDLYRVYNNGTLANFYRCGSEYFISKNSPKLIQLKKADELLNAVSDDEDVYRTLTSTKYEFENIALIIKRYNFRNKTINQITYDRAEL